MRLADTVACRTLVRPTVALLYTGYLYTVTAVTLDTRQLVPASLKSNIKLVKTFYHPYNKVKVSLSYCLFICMFLCLSVPNDLAKRYASPLQCSFS